MLFSMFSSILCSSGWISIPQLEHPERSQQGRVDTNTHISKVFKEVYGGTVLPISSSLTAGGEAAETNRPVPQSPSQLVVKT